MAATLVQAKSGSNTGTTALAIPLTSNTSTGDTLIVAVNCDQTSDKVSSITATGMTFNKITLASGLIGGGAASYISIWYAFNVTGATTPTVTINKSATSGIEAVLFHYSGFTTTDPLDKVNRAVGTTTAITTGTTATLSQANEVVVICGASDAGGDTYTPGSGYANLTQKAATAGDIAMADKTVASTTAVSGSFTLVGGASDNAGAIMTFLISGGTTYNDAITETSTSSDSEVGIANDNAAFSESGASSDTAIANASDIAVLSETGTSLDSYIGGKATSDNLTESSVTSDLVNGALTVNGNMTEQIIPTDAFSGVATDRSSLTESDTASDSVILVSGATYNDFLTESSASSDSESGLAVDRFSLTENAAANDNYTGTGGRPFVIITPAISGGAADISRKKYLEWLAQKSKKKIKKIEESIITSVAPIKEKIKPDFKEKPEEINYDNIINNFTDKKREMAAVKSEIQKQLENQKEEEFFLMRM